MCQGPEAGKEQQRGWAVWCEMSEGGAIRDEVRGIGQIGTGRPLWGLEVVFQWLV